MKISKILFVICSIVLCISVVSAINTPPMPEYTPQPQISIELVNDWNLVSFPLLPEDTSVENVMGNCEYNRIWRFELGQYWTSTDTGLVDFELTRGYWIDRIGFDDNCTLHLSGQEPDSTEIELSEGWNLVGFPSLTEQKIKSFIDDSLYEMIWEYQDYGGWKNLDVGLNTMKPTKGYWLYSNAGGSYNVEKYSGRKVYKNRGMREIKINR